MKRPVTTSLGLAIALLAPLEAAAEEWNVSLWGQRRAFTEHVERLAEIVAYQSDGEFTINISYGGLAKNRENLDGIAAGDFEMAQFCAAYHRDKNPTITVMELPFLGITTLEEERAVSEAVYSHPAVVEDLDRWNAKLLMPTPLPQYNVVGIGDTAQSIEDFSGKRIRASGGIAAAFKTVGVEPVSLTATETFDAMKSGDVDLVSFAQHAHFSFKTINLATWWTSNLNPGSVNCPIVVNTDAYAALSDEHRKILDDAIEPSMAHYMTYYDELILKWDQILQLFNVEKVAFSQEDLDDFRLRAAQPAREAWIADMQTRGIDGASLLATVEDALKNARLNGS